ncbi:MAG TPA: efflux RND transporter periplasmic adaptor subunit [Steroidobacteraceae bacterium]|nr:efflux RND transporter periplasmic adaptor subunit [Steroidobacteraceae bacterium]
MESASADDGHKTAHPKAMIRPIVIMIILVALVLGGIFAWQSFIGRMMKKGMMAGATAPQTVATIVAAPVSWQSRTQAVGSLRAVRGADLASQASGVVDKIEFESGAEVRAGTALLRLKPYDDPAKLAQLEAAAVLAEQTYQRDQEQFAAQAISQATLDSDVSILKSAHAQVAAQQALIEEKIVRAPFAGKLGIRLVDEGQYLSAGTTVVTLQALDPILIDFYVPQQALASLKVGQAAMATVDTYPGTRFKGTVTSINSKVDTASRNVQVRASFANADRRLIPGMYANVEIDSAEAGSELALPQTAITYNAYGDTVFVVKQAGVDASGKPQSVAEQRFVQLGPTRGDQVAVRSGIAAGDVIVTVGQMKLRNGTPVVVNNTVQPPNDISPTPPNE